MPRKSARSSLADRDPAPGGAAAVDRALALLIAFSPDRPRLSLAELAAATGLYKSTALRLLASLEHRQLVVRDPEGRYAPGPETARLFRSFTAAFSIEAAVMPILRLLVEATGESAAFYVRRGDRRLCLHRVDSTKPVRDHIRVGDLLPLDRGASGRVLTAYAGEEDSLSATIRRELVVALVGDRVPELAGIAAPVFGPSGDLVGSLTLTMPTERFDARLAAAVRDAARQLTRAIGGRFAFPDEG